MRHTCQVFVGAKRCGEPAVDFVEIPCGDFTGEVPEFYSTKVSMCAAHWDEYRKNKKLVKEIEGLKNDKP